MGSEGLLIENFFAQASGKEACGKYGLSLLSETSHVVRARSVATAAAECVFRARLGEVMGVRGFQHSVIPGKGQVVHLVMAIAFPVIFREYVSSGELSDQDYRGIVEGSLEWLIDDGIIDLTHERAPREDIVLELSEELARGGIEFVTSAFNKMFDGDAGDALSRSIVLTEHNLLSFKLHVWGVADVIVEDPITSHAVVIEWKSYSPQEHKTPQPTNVDIAQAYVYAMLEAERLRLVSNEDGFDSYVNAILGSPPSGNGARIIPGVVRPTPTGKTSRMYVRHPLLCVSATSPKCEYYSLRDFLAKIVLAAEHLTMSITDLRRLNNWALIEDLCKVSRRGRSRSVFRLIPEITLDGKPIRLPKGYPLGEHLRWPCNICPDNVREACIYFMTSSIDPVYENFRYYRNEAWRARFAVYEHRENALLPYKYFLQTALDFGVDMSWIKGHLSRRVLPDGSRIDLFDDSWIEGDELVLVRRPMRWEIENSHLFTLREGKPAAVYFNEDHVYYPLHRLSFHGSVTSVEYDGESNRVVVRISPANKMSRIYSKILEYHYYNRQVIFRNIVALEVNVELTQLELLGIVASEMGTIKRAAKAIEESKERKELGEEDLLALMFTGAPIELGGG